MNLKNKKILVFTGGGLSPSLNPTLYGVINEAKKRKAKICGGFFGWHCLTNEGEVINLNNFKEEKIKDSGGTFLRSSRTNPYKFKDGFLELKKNIKEKSIDCIVAIGGNDTLGAAYKIFKEREIPIVGVPKTIDNDLSVTYFTPGFISAAHKLINFTREIKNDAAQALSRIFIVESLGEKAGWLAAAGYLGGADLVIPPEKYIDVDRVVKLVKLKYKKNNNFAVIVMAKEAQLGNKIKGLIDDQKDDYGVARHELTCWGLKKEIKKRLGFDTKILMPGNWLQSGQAVPLEKKLSIALGRRAVKLLAEDKVGWSSIIKKRGYKLTVGEAPLKEIHKKRLLDEKMFDFKKLVPTKVYLNYLKPILK